MNKDNFSNFFDSSLEPVVIFRQPFLNLSADISSSDLVLVDIDRLNFADKDKQVFSASILSSLPKEQMKLVAVPKEKLNKDENFFMAKRPDGKEVFMQARLISFSVDLGGVGLPNERIKSGDISVPVFTDHNKNFDNQKGFADNFRIENCKDYKVLKADIHLDKKTAESVSVMLSSGNKVSLSAGIALSKYGKSEMIFNKGDKNNPDKVNWLKAIDLEEVSFVGVGADPAAQVDKDFDKNKKENMR